MREIKFEGEVIDVDPGARSIEIKGMGNYTARLYTWFKREGGETHE